jgi:PIN domain nuclease of toxin-antitoxin system
MGDGRLSEKARQAYLDPENRIYLSAASFWEIGIKTSLGKLSLKNEWLKGFEEQRNTGSTVCGKIRRGGNYDGSP